MIDEMLGFEEIRRRLVCGSFEWVDMCFRVLIKCGSCCFCSGIWPERNAS